MWDQQNISNIYYPPTMKGQSYSAGCLSRLSLIASDGYSETPS